MLTIIMRITNTHASPGYSVLGFVPNSCTAHPRVQHEGLSRTSHQNSLWR